ncbi:SGNH/GDSL hydrolase family protein [Pontibacter qinzhouensis]|uniref:SGNH/GDSL hydrolase family protein n=1 Tax=Pontibacter qinzhouensis TaxID=2603253 RepID=A0A5C8JA96_9BACT|nr:SGNH/GDSL hydrolase family protein [Pontibacter qinzhouensis]TXK33903.1 SGNH/GDSL hydrolase family protein [Pontibacter qinzhouensis]
MHQENNEGRRKFLKTASIGGLAALSIPAIVSSALAKEKVKKVRLQQNDTILFQGDSITDARRKRDDSTVNSAAALGTGYAFMAASDLLCNHADKGLNIYNKGISGNKVYQLAERWDAEALDLKPNVLSILIGVNDFWHTLVNNYTGTLKTYQDDYQALLDRTKQRLPEVKLIIGEPFAVPGIKSVDQTWFPAFNDYRQAAREIAASYGAVFIPYQSVFDKAQKTAPGVYWTYDGVHPTIAGNRLMAQAWMETVKG